MDYGGRVASGTATLSQREVGDRLGLTTRQVIRAERRALRKIEDEIKRLARRDGVKVGEWLFGNTH